MPGIVIDAKRASKRECVRYIAALQEENKQLKTQLGRADAFISGRLRQWPYTWANWIKPFFPKPKKGVVKAVPKEVPNA